MKDYFRYHESVNLNEIKVFGAYDRDTNLPHSIDHNTDVDIMRVMDDDGWTPQTYFDRVRSDSVTPLKAVGGEWLEKTPS